MKRGAFDFGHYVPYFGSVVLVALFLYLTINYHFGEQEVTIFHRSLQLEDAFTVHTLLHCFSDSQTHRFALSRFTQEVLDACIERDARVIFAPLGQSTAQPIVLGDPHFSGKTFVKEYVASDTSSGVLLIEL